MFFKRFFVICLQRLKILSALSMRLVQLTGKHPERVHPKHLVKNKTPWYVKYLNKNDVVLDVGCANGQHTIKAARYCKKIIGFDVDDNQLGIARQEASQKKINNIELRKSSAEDPFPYPKNFFDKVLFFDVIEHLAKRDLALREINRVLKPDGVLLMAAPNKETSWKKLQASLGLPYFSDPDHKIEYSKSEIKKILAQHKFKILKIFPVVYDTPLAPIFDLIGGFSLSAYSKMADWKRKKAVENPSESNGFEIVAINQK